MSISTRIIEEGNDYSHRKSKSYFQYTAFANVINEIIRSFEEYSMKNDLNYDAFKEPVGSHHIIFVYSRHVECIVLIEALND